MRHEHAHQRKTRRLLLELQINRFLGARKRDGGDQFAGLQGGAEHAEEKVLGRNDSAGRVDVRTQSQHGTGVAGTGVIVGHRAPDGAHGANLFVANVSRQIGQRWQMLFDQGIGGHLRVLDHGANDQLLAIQLDLFELRDL